MLNGCTRQNNPADGGTSQALENVHGLRSDARNFFQDESCFPFFLVLERESVALRGVSEKSADPTHAAMASTCWYVRGHGHSYHRRGQPHTVPSLAQTTTRGGFPCREVLCQKPPRSLGPELLSPYVSSGLPQMSGIPCGFQVPFPMSYDISCCPETPTLSQGTPARTDVGAACVCRKYTHAQLCT